MSIAAIPTNQALANIEVKRAAIQADIDDVMQHQTNVASATFERACGNPGYGRQRYYGPQYGSGSANSLGTTLTTIPFLLSTSTR